MKQFFSAGLLVFSLMVSACGGGGGGTGSNEPPPPTQPISFVLQLSLPEAPPEGTIVRSAKAVITVPSNVTVGTVGGSIDVVIPSGIAAFKITEIVENELTVTVASTDLNNGLPTGIFALVNCSYIGTPPQFTQPTYEIAGGPPGEITGGEFEVIPNMSVVLTTQ